MLGLPDDSPAPHRASHELLEGKRRVSGARQPQSHAGALLGDVRQREAAQPLGHTEGAPPAEPAAPLPFLSSEPCA